MSQELRHKVLLLLAFPTEDHYLGYNQAFSLLLQTPNRDKFSDRTYNAGFSERLYSSLLYDLKKYHKISDLDVHLAATEVTAEKVIEEEVPKKDAQKKESVKDFVPSPDTVERNRLRDDFPFLKDADCPNELKILVSDKITAYDNYVNAHNKLQLHVNGTHPLSEEEQAELTRVSVESFEENRSIYAELDHFKSTGKILGDHPIFRKLQLSREVESMANEEMVKYLGSSRKFLSDKKKSLDAARKKKDEQKVSDISKAMELREEKLALVKKKLNIQ